MHTRVLSEGRFYLSKFNSKTSDLDLEVYSTQEFD